MLASLPKRFMKWLKLNFWDLFFSLILLTLTTFIAIKNYTPGTYLTGWDNLHPEFNFKLNIERSLNAAWQEYQGVGLLGGMGHGADLPRQLFLWLTSLVLPTALIRYFWTFLMLFSGPFGVYFLLKKKSKIGAFTASIFYIFNLATVQYFYVPFETFVNFYGFLPWLVFFVLRYLNSGKSKDLLFYFLVSIFATTAFYVQTLFLVYAVFLLVLCLGRLARNFKRNLPRSILILFVMFLVNGFWLLPTGWFSLTSSWIPQNSQINRIATPETVYMNQGRSDFSDIVNLRGYWFDYYDFGKNEQFDYLFKTWISWQQKPYVSEIGIAFFGLSVLGLFLSGQFELILLFAISYAMLAGVNLPNSTLTEAFRNAFTKWSVAFAFVEALGLGFLVSKFKKISVILAVLVVAGAVYTTYPILQGELVSKRVETTIPNEYFETFNWFNQNTKGERIAYFPGFDKWGWNYHDWGYGGSGFIWYGIKNPVLDRAFNVWSPYNEGFYNEITKSILDNDISVFKNILEKYQVRYLFLDNSIDFPWGDKNLLKLTEVEDFASQLGYPEVFNSGFVTIYDTNVVTDKFVLAPPKYTSLDVNLIYSPVDPTYSKYGDYVQDGDGVSYPFVNFDPRGDVGISEVNDQLVFINNATNSKVEIPIAGKLEETFEEGHGYQDSYNCDLKNNGSVERTISNHSRTYVAKDGGVSCDYFVFENAKYNSAYVLHVKGNNSQGRSLKVYLYNWETKRVEVEELLPEGDFDSYFVVYPKPNIIGNSRDLNADSGEDQTEVFQGGYTLNVETRSFGRVSSANEVDTLDMIPFDINLLTSIYKSNINFSQELTQTNNLNIENVKKYGTAIYKVGLSGNGLLQLGQGYEPGWIAFQSPDSYYQIPGTLRHVKVSGWSNGWFVPEGSGEIYIVFWPQLLEWGGFVLLLITFSVLVRRIHK